MAGPLCEHRRALNPSRHQTNMKIHSLASALIALLVAALPTASRATITVTINSNGGWCYVPANGVGDLPVGSVIRVGQFDLSNPANYGLLQTSNDYALLNSFFTPLAEGLPGAGTVNQAGATGEQIIINDQFEPGHVFGQIVNISSSYFVTGTPLFVWVFNSATPQTATEWGIYTSATDWNVPADLGSTTLSTFEAVQVVRGGESNGNHFNLAPVPEPGSIVLLLMGAGLMRWRARKGTMAA